MTNGIELGMSHIQDNSFSWFFVIILFLFCLFIYLFIYFIVGNNVLEKR